MNPIHVASSVLRSNSQSDRQIRCYFRDYICKQSPSWWSGWPESRKTSQFRFSALIPTSTTVWRSKIIMNQYLWEMSIKILFWKRFRCLTHNFTKKLLVNTIWFSLHQELFILSRDRITCDSRIGRWEWGGIWIHFLGWYEVYKSSRSS